MPKKLTNKKTAYLSAVDIAELLSVSERTISTWLKSKGLPHKTERGIRRFIWADVLPWYVDMKVSEARSAGSRALKDANQASEQVEFNQESPDAVPTEDFRKALTRKTIAEADLKELELATKRGEVVAIADVQRTLENTANTLRTKILGWPTLMIGRIFGVKDRNALFAILTRSATDICRDLMATDPDAAK